MSPSKIIDVAAGLVFRNGRLLITQRKPETHCGGLWEFPGGKREPGETFEACLARELREELDIEVRVCEEFDSLVHHYPEKTVSLHFFRCEWVAREPRAVDCHDLAWVGRDDLVRYEFPPADARLLDKLRQASNIGF
jgi:mutator protein MutT